MKQNRILQENYVSTTVTEPWSSGRTGFYEGDWEGRTGELNKLD